MKKIYGSSSAFAWGRLVITDSKAGCLRAIVLQANGVREGKIDPIHTIRGALNEENHEQHLKSLGETYEKEKPISYVIEENGEDRIVFSGRADFVRTLSSGELEVDELKSTESKYVRADAIKKGKFKSEHLAQAIAYMAALHTVNGRLIYTYYEKENEKYVAKDEKCYEILIDQSGTICLDGKPTKFSIFDFVQHQKLAVEHLKENKIADRPMGWENKFGGPCRFCVFKEACDEYDSGTIERNVRSFCDRAKQLVKEKETHE